MNRFVRSSKLILYKSVCSGFILYILLDLIWPFLFSPTHIYPFRESYTISNSLENFHLILIYSLYFLPVSPVWLYYNKHPKNEIWLLYLLIVVVLYFFLWPIHLPLEHRTFKDDYYFHLYVILPLNEMIFKVFYDLRNDLKFY